MTERPKLQAALNPLASARPLVLPVAAVIATGGRPDALAHCLETLATQDVRIAEVLVVDASDDDLSRRACDQWLPQFAAGRWIAAPDRGAAVQRNAGVALATQPYVLFVDDDVEVQPGCLAALWAAVSSDSKVGGASSMIVNQQYSDPGLFTRLLLRIAGSGGDPFPAGRCLGPAFNVLPADRPDLPEVMPVDWLNTTCTLYRRAALPSGVFSNHFVGYSVFEDVDLSLTVGRRWRLVNARTARVMHHSLIGPFKPNTADMAEMILVNRHYTMTRTLGRTSVSDHARLALVEALLVLTTLQRISGWRDLPAVLWGKLRGVRRILHRGEAP